jgi:SRSO17 transposase
MLDGRRKSVQPMAERLPDGNMQALQQFVNQSPWEWTPVRQRIAERLCEAIRPEVWVVDDVSFPKCGTASVGVARQYCGALGKRANCQVAVSVHAATDAASCPLEWELFLPEEWAHDQHRRRRAGLPEEVGHLSKTQLALGLLDRLAARKLAVPVIVADAGYGRSVAFRLALAMIPRISWSLAPASRASNRRCAYSGGRCTVRRLNRPSSVVPTGAV